MVKIDHKKILKDLYRPSAKQVMEVQVPALNFLMADGKGDPNSSPLFAEAVEALFSVSYTLKFLIKKNEPFIDYSVMPLEGLWWADDMQSFSVDKKEDWYWTLMIMQPEYVTAGLVQKAVNAAAKKKTNPSINKLRFEAYQEGLSAQIMHIGPFTEEGPTVEKVHNYIELHGFRRSGRHHEVYLSDIRRADPAKWKTVIRQPFLK